MLLFPRQIRYRRRFMLGSEPPEEDLLLLLKTSQLYNSRKANDDLNNNLRATQTSKHDLQEVLVLVIYSLPRRRQSR